MSLSLAINKNNPLLRYAKRCKQIDWKLWIGTSIFLFAVAFSVYGALNSIMGFITEDKKNPLVKELNKLAAFVQKNNQIANDAYVEAILTAQCLYPKKINKIIYHNKVTPMVTGIHSFTTPNTEFVNPDSEEFNIK